MKINLMTMNNKSGFQAGKVYQQCFFKVMEVMKLGDNKIEISIHPCKELQILKDRIFSLEEKLGIKHEGFDYIIDEWKDFEEALKRVREGTGKPIPTDKIIL